MRQAKLRDREGFRRVFDARRDEVFRFLYRLTGHRHDAEDLLQDTFARLWSKRSQYQGTGSLNGYLKKIAYRTYLNARPRIERGRALHAVSGSEPDPGPGPATAAGKKECDSRLQAQVRAAVRELPDSWREPFVLFRFEGFKCREIAELMDLSLKAVEMRLAKALKRVAARLVELRTENNE